MNDNTVSRQLLGNRWLTLLFLTFFVAVCSAPSASATATAYVQPELLGAGNSRLSAIVTGADLEGVEQAVEAVGGQITSRLWLIDGVGATLNKDQVRVLARHPVIESILNNRGIRSAERGGNGYMSERRQNKGFQELAGDQETPAVPLPDGGAVSVSKNGSVRILNEDGSTRADVTLMAGHYKTAPIVASDGTIFVAEEEDIIYAITPDGAVRWTFTGLVGKVKAGLALGPFGNIYAVDEDRWLYALDGSNGRELWRKLIGRDYVDKIKQPPIVTAEGNIYLVSEKGFLIALGRDGSRRWSFQANVDKPFYSPLVSDGTIYVANDERNVYGVNASDGSLIFTFETLDRIKARPTLGPDGTLYVPDEHLRLYALNPDGSERFLFQVNDGGHFKTSPIVSDDGSLVYIAGEDKLLFAVDATTGVERWRYQTAGKIKSSPTFDPWGNVVVGSEDNELVLLSPAGELLHARSVPGKVKQTPGRNGAGDLIVRLDNDKLVTVGRLPDEWNGTPDVLATSDPMVWEFLAPVTIDVGADVLHDDLLQHGQPVTGEGVTVAVVDSGVYFDSHVKDVLGTDVEKLFLGQADFVDEGRCEASGGDYEQYEYYCWTNHKTSADHYGHGSHVAGTIWNHFTDLTTEVKAGVAPEANILSVRVLGDDGIGTYEDVIEGIQFVVSNKEILNIRVLNLSLSAHAATPYFVDPLNRAVEAAWAEGIVVLAAAGNIGPGAETVTVPGNDPYVITVGAIDSKRTVGYWADDIIPAWSSTGPTQDGFIKPDVLAPGTNIVSFMYNDPENKENSAYLVRNHPDYAETTSLFRMNGTSMATAVTSGVVALMLEANPQLTPDQVKYRLMAAAKSALTPDEERLFSPLQQGAGRIWAPDAVFGELPLESANAGMDIQVDLSHPWQEGDTLDPDVNPDLYYHYLGPVQRLVSDDGQFYLYFVADDEDDRVLDPLGIARTEGGAWQDSQELDAYNPTFNEGQWAWSDHYLWSGGRYSWGGGRYSWSGGRYSWSGGRYSWSGGRYSWGGGRYSWSGGRYSWSGGRYSWSGGRYSWSGSTGKYPDSNVAATTWVDE
ncbi:MAG: S8 family serine peptidase [Candidatus Promineifilaceae bacterium]|nr:S8 family serine peptidase [Candidatus Promineifilaceae bacterium]